MPVRVGDSFICSHSTQSEIPNGTIYLLHTLNNLCWIFWFWRLRCKEGKRCGRFMCLQDLPFIFLFSLWNELSGTRAQYHGSAYRRIICFLSSLSAYRASAELLCEVCKRWMPSNVKYGCALTKIPVPAPLKKSWFSHESKKIKK